MNKLSNSTLFKSHWTRWSLVLIWMAVIFALSHQANSGTVTEEYFGVMNVPIRKMGHLGEYLILYVLLRWALSGIESSITKHYSLLALILSILYAASDELHQHFVIGRSASARDVLIDSIGALLGLILYLLMTKFVAKYRNSPSN